MTGVIVQLGETPEKDAQIRSLLKQARDTYGNTAQILVSNEELCELAAVCAKFPRYKDADRARAELHSKALDEVADVLIVLDHIISIMQLSNEDILDRIEFKMARMKRWLTESTSQEQTTKDRVVQETHCKGCAHVGNFQALKQGGTCFVCCQTNWSNYTPKENQTE